MAAPLTPPAVAGDDADTPAARLDAGLAALGVAASDQQRRQLLGYVDLLARWNRAYNLTAVRDPLEMIPKHLLDSLAVLPWVRRAPVLDVGTGAGLPGLPLAIMRPDLAFTLLDGSGKKVRFVRQAVLELELCNVTPVQARMEAYRVAVKFATITARAVTSLDALCARCAALLAPGGVLLALKGRDPGPELDALAAAPPPRVDAAAAVVHQLRVPMLEAERCVIEVPFS